MAISSKKPTAMVSAQHLPTYGDKPNLNGDRLNCVLLTLLYSMQNMPIAFSAALPIIMQSRKMVTYGEQALFSVVMWPFSMKLVMAPIVDSLYWRRLGRRKSWLIPLQYSIGILLIYFAVNTDEWLPESGKPNLKMIVIVLFANNFLTATQDVVVDSWALTMLKKNNVNYSSTCSSMGISIGMFVGFVCPVLLSSEEFCNANLRATPSTGGIISIKSFVLFWGFIFSLTTTLIGIFKKENNAGSEDDHVKTSILHTYKLIWNIINIKHMKFLLVAVLTSLIGFLTMDLSLASLKIIDAGASKDSITIINSVLMVLKICVPLVITKYTAGPNPMDLYLLMTPIRLLWSVVYAVFVYYTPYLLKNNEEPNSQVYYYVLLTFISAINEIFFVTMMTCVVAFFSRISDPLFGGTYMTLLNTVRNLGWTVPNSCVLKLIETFTIRSTCTIDDVQNSSALDIQSKSNCPVVVDGYYVEVALCLVIGFIWYGVFKDPLKRFQSLDRSHWLIESNRRTQDKSKPLR